MRKANIDVAVALIFFVRPDTLEQVFNKIREARPSKLFLIQDGARDNNINDEKLIQECRNIVSNVDWECEVYRNYSDINLGCGERPHTGISWVFEHVDKAIILEDDCVPAESFFEFCKIMLDKYETDNRIGIISGLNHFSEYDFGNNSYGFVKSGSIWGWATWKDRWQEYDFTMQKFNNEYLKKSLIDDITPQFAARKRVNTWKNAYNDIKNDRKVSYWDYQWGFVRHLNSWLSIVPKYNQITNIGIGLGSTHSGNNIELLPNKTRGFFFKDTKLLEFPLVDPNFVIADRNYDKRYYSIIYPNFMLKTINRIKRIIKIQFIKFKSK
ncbi:hypothetical protein [Exiguobacterium sp. s50]|uniref:hypothetical protein n=1 Tax=Exiguobacterium sp. s50 TaxID=2751234 RepID=UPI001BE8DA47|nr:hypothetical protein [Exiguobacterium sp. s50]